MTWYLHSKFVSKYTTTPACESARISCHGFEFPPFFQVHASAAKMGVNSLTRSFALEWADYGTCSNGISPGAIADTAGTAKLGGMGGNSEKAAGSQRPPAAKCRRQMTIQCRE